MRAITLAATFMLLVAGCGRFHASALDEIRQRGELRVVTLNLPTCYYLGAQAPEGLEYELASQFAEQLGVKLTMYPVANERAMQAELAAGRADIAAASLTSTPAGSAWAWPPTPYTLIPQLVVYQNNGVRPRDTLQLESARSRCARAARRSACWSASRARSRRSSVGGDRTELGGPDGGC